MFEEQVYIREQIVDGVGPWAWTKGDSGAWDGPVDDWLTSHKQAYLRHCRKFDVCLTAGGNQGLYPRLLSDHFNRVYTFEPDALNFYCLNLNCQSDRIFKYQAALGAQHKMISIARAPIDNVGMHRVDETLGAVPMLMIDDFDFETLDFIQLDVEGYEINVLRGALKTIAIHHPVISCENGRDEITQLLDSLGYEKKEVSKADSIYALK